MSYIDKLYFLQKSRLRGEPYKNPVEIDYVYLDSKTESTILIDTQRLLVFKILSLIIRGRKESKSI